MVKIHLSNQDLLAQNLTVFLFLGGNIFWEYPLEAPHVEGLLMGTHNICFLREVRKIHTS